MIFEENGTHRKAEVTILISDNIDFKITTVTYDEDGHFMIKETLHQEDITALAGVAQWVECRTVN